ncbi:unnamed protein product [Calicophoron daubneyi]|uniref:C2 domain-containing protein n=1 Tax=Calicophoron daubneyi TaxID=300641 RepID=A0AAV2TP77_CALDB
MSLKVSVRYLDGLVGKSDRSIKASFRESKQKAVVKDGRESVYFGKEMEWPVSRPLDDTDVLTLQAFNVKKTSSSLLGTVRISLFCMTREPVMSFRENLIDESSRPTNMILTFEIRYRSPDSTAGALEDKALSYPVTAGDYGFDEREDAEAMGADFDSGFNPPVPDYTINPDALLGEQEERAEDTHFPVPEERDPRIAKMLAPTVYKAKIFQLAVNVIEARKLYGTNVNPVVMVSVGKTVQKTRPKLSTNRPFYDSYFTFDITKPREQFLYETLRIRVVSVRDHPMLRLLPGKLIGEFVTDVQTIYEYKEHTILNKWALLVDPKDPWGGAKGFVRVDLCVLEEGKQMPRTKREKTEDDENIEANLLLPRYLRGKKQETMVSMGVQIYQAEDLPPMHTELSNQLRQAFVGSGAANVDPYVEVSFGGYTAKTKVKRYESSPTWNQELVFSNYYPPLSHALRINVKNAGVKGELIATRLIDLNYLMERGSNGYFPTYGPAWVNLYGTPRIYTYAQMLRPEDELNMGLGEGVAYRGRLLLGIQSKEDATIEKVGASLEVASPVSETVAGKKCIYFLFASVFDAAVIDSKLGSRHRPIQFEVSMGLFGNKLDGKRGGVEEIPLEFVKAPEGRERVDWCESTTEPIMPVEGDKDYYYLDIQNRKPNMFMITYFEDQRLRMCVPNILERLKNYVESGLDRVRYLYLTRRPRMTRRYFRRFLKRLSEHMKVVEQEIVGCRGTAPRTKLDIRYTNRVRRDLLRMAEKAEDMSMMKSDEVGMTMKEANSIVKRIEELMEFPQDSLPDLFISMIIDGQRVGFARVPARDIYYSAVANERGKWNGQIATLYIRKQGREGMGEQGWKIQCQLRIFLWLSLLKDFVSYRENIPKGVSPDCFFDVKPPKEIVYTPRQRFELRCYIFIARNLICADSTGTSDPLARIIIKEHVLETQTLYKTSSPMWDVLLHKEVVFYYEPESVKQSMNEIIVELFDVDPGRELEFLGRAFCQVQVYIDGDQYKPARLQWWPIFRGQTPAGEILAAFDLIQCDTQTPFTGIPTYPELAAYTKDFDDRIVLMSIPHMVLSDDEDINRDTDDDEEESEYYPTSEEDEDLLNVDAIVHPSTSSYMGEKKSKQIKLGLAPPSLVITRREEDYRIPENVRPPLKRFRLEVMFWSMFGVVRQQLLPVKRPKVVLEIGGTKVESEIIQDLTKHRLFEQHLRVVDVFLPEDERYWPPLVMNSYDNRPFGLKVIIGSHTFANVRPYLKVKVEDAGSESTVAAYDEPEFGGRLNFGFDLEGQEPIPMEDEDEKKSKVEFDEKPALTEVSESEEPAEPMPTPEMNLDEINPSFVPVNSMPDEKTVDTDQISLSKRPFDTSSEPTKEQLESADWWTRFYATLKSDQYVEEEQVDVLTDSEDSEFSEDLEKRNVELHPEEKVPEPETLKRKKRRHRFWEKKKWWKTKKIEVDERGLSALEKRKLEMEKKRRKRIKKKKLRKRLAEQLTGDAEKRFKSEKTDLTLNEPGEKESDKWVQRIMLYPCELEDIPPFSGFVEPFRNIPLYKGKQTEDELSEESRLAGYVKGNLLIYDVDEDAEMPTSADQLQLYKRMPTRAHVKLTVRVYIVRALGLHPSDANGLADPYCLLSLGNVVVNDRDDYKPKTLHPVFGKFYEFTAQLPMDSMLVLQIMDYDRLGSDDLIGETRIDIENRFHSPHRATCGIMEKYYTFGYAKWKDSIPPTAILERLCKERGIPQPEYNLLEDSVTVQDQKFYANTTILTETGGQTKSIEPLALQVLQNFQALPNGIELMREHVETRSLSHPEKPGISQGKVQMWVDIFERELAVPPPAINIAPRQPVNYELRVIIWNTADVILNDTSIFSSEQSSDIYVKGWLQGVGYDEQKTDVHYRSLSGEGNFNWRFVFPFSYIPAEDRIIYPVKGPFDIEPQMIKSNAELTLQIWDADLLSSDNFLGSIVMKLNEMPQYAKTPKSCGLHQLAKDCPKFSIFKNRNVRGWWPCADIIFEQQELQGKVECEISLHTQAEAENSPAGQGRDEPMALPKPNRPDSSFFKFLGPLNSCFYFLKYRLKWILIKILIIFLVLLIVALFIYSFPHLIARKIMNV